MLARRAECPEALCGPDPEALSRGRWTRGSSAGEGGLRERAGRLAGLRTGLETPSGRGPHLSIALVVPGRPSPSLRAQVRPPPGCKWAEGGGGDDLMAVTRDSSQGLAGAEPRVPALGRGPPRAELSCRGLGVGQLCSRPQELFLSGAFPGGSHPPGTPGKRGPYSAVTGARAVGLDLCPEPASPEGLGPQSRPRDTPAGRGASTLLSSVVGVCGFFSSQAAATALGGGGAMTGL